MKLSKRDDEISVGFILKKKQWMFSLIGCDALKIKISLILILTDNRESTVADRFWSAVNQI